MNLIEELGILIQDIVKRREQIKNDFVRSYLAASLIHTGVDIDNLIKSLELVEEWNHDRTKVVWYFRVRK